MTFKAKLSKQGNSYCIYIPKDVRTKLELNVDYEWSVRTETTNVRTPEPARDNVITSEDYTMEPDDTVKRADTFKV